MEIIKAETMNPRKRFSLRLSAKLTYGVLKLYERQSHLLLHSAFSLNLAITKRRVVEEEKPKKKVKKPTTVEQVTLQNVTIQQVEEQLIPEADVIKMLNSIQCVPNTGITLRENALVPFQNRQDNFGEEEDPMAIFQQESVLGKVGDATAEQTLPSIIVVEAQVHRADESIQSKEKDDSHLKRMLHSSDEQVIIEASKTLESSRLDEITNLENVTTAIPELQVTSVLKDITNENVVNRTEAEIRLGKRRHEAISLDETPTLDPNVTLPAPKKRKRVTKDASISLHHDYMKTRIQNFNVDLRCEHPVLDAMNIEAVISDMRFTLPQCAFRGRRLLLKIKRVSEILRKAFIRNMTTKTVPDDKQAFKKPRQIEQVRAETTMDRSQNLTMNVAISNIEDQHTTILPQNGNINVNNMSIVVPSPIRSVVNIQDRSMMPDVTIPEIDMSLNTTVETATTKLQKQRKLPTSIITTTLDEIRDNISKSVSSNVSDKRKKTTADKRVLSKENVSLKEHMQIQEMNEILPLDVQNSQTDQLAMDVQNLRKEVQIEIVNTDNTQGRSSNNETMMGSLDRTQVSLGDDSVTHEEKMVKDYLEREWGNMGVWQKLVSAKRAKCYPLDVEVLVRRERIPSNIPKRRVAANVFNAILLLKKYKFIKVDKYPEALTILNIKRGEAVKTIIKEN